MQHVLAAELLQPPLDVAFFALKARQAQMESTSTSQFNTITRISFEKHLTYARKHVITTLAAQARFWLLLSDVKPDISALMSLTVQMNKATAAAEIAFEELFRLNAQVREP